jgi:serine/threonine-protein kinase
MTAQPFPFETVPIGSAIPPKMKAAVMRALAKDKNLRQQSVKEFYLDFTLADSRPSAIFAVRGSGADLAGMPSSMHPPSTPPLTHASQPPPPMTAGTSGLLPAPSFSDAQAPGVYPSSPAMSVPAGAYPGAPQVPPPPPPTARKASGGLVLGIVALAAIAGVVAGVIFFKGKPATGSEKGDASGHPASTATASASVDAGKPAPVPPPDDAGAPAADAGPHPADTHAEQACHHAEAAATHDNLPEARRWMNTCDGPGKAAARAAIDAAELRVHHLGPPCPRGRHCPPGLMH